MQVHAAPLISVSSPLLIIQRGRPAFFFFFFFFQPLRTDLKPWRRLEFPVSYVKRLNIPTGMVGACRLDVAYEHFKVRHPSDSERCKVYYFCASGVLSSV